MKQKFLLLLLLPFLFAACVKDGDFDALGHKMEISGQFDPVYGFPLANAEMSTGDIISLLDSSSALIVFDENNMVTLRYNDTTNLDFNFNELKGKTSRKGFGLPDPSDTAILDSRVVEGEAEIDLFDKISDFAEGQFEVEGMYVSLKSTLTTHVNDIVMAAIDHGAEVYFDSVQMTLVCQNGADELIDLGESAGKISVSELVSGKELVVFDEYNISHLVRKRPHAIRYTMRLNIIVTYAALMDAGGDYIETAAFMRDSLCVTGISSQSVINFDFPMQIYCQNLVYNDTMDFDMTKMDSLMVKAEQYLTMGDSSYLIIKTKNGIPASLALNMTNLDEHYMPLGAPILGTNNTIKGAPIGTVSGYYVATGTSDSEIRVPLSQDAINQMRKAKHILLTLLMSTSTLESNPSAHTPISIRKEDKLSINLYTLLAPHINFSIGSSK